MRPNSPAQHTPGILGNNNNLDKTIMTRKQTVCTALKKDSAGEGTVRWENWKDTATVWTEQSEFGPSEEQEELCPWFTRGPHG